MIKDVWFVIENFRDKTNQKVTLLFFPIKPRSGNHFVRDFIFL
jgi:hypothetical protein